MEKIRVLFICNDNSIRSPMAAEFLNAYFADRYQAHSAGITPSRINPYAVKVMKEIGIDLSFCRAKGVEEFRGKKFDCVICLCDQAKTAISSFPEHKKDISKSFKAYCIPMCCDSAGKSALCFPLNTQPDKNAAKDNEENILASFRNLREEIFKWIEKEAVI